MQCRLCAVLMLMVVGSSASYGDQGCPLFPVSSTTWVCDVYVVNGGNPCFGPTDRRLVNGTFSNPYTTPCQSPCFAAAPSDPNEPPPRDMYQTGYVGGRLKQGAFEHPLPDIVSNEVRTPKLVTLGATGVTIAVELIEYDILSTPGPRHAQFALEIVPPREGIDGEPLVASSVENSEFVYETRIGHHSVFVILAGSEE